MTDGGIETVQTLLTSACRLLEKLKVHLPALPLQGMHPKESKSNYKRNNCNVLCIHCDTTHKTKQNKIDLWNHPTCSPTAKQIKEMWNTYTMDFYSPIRNSEIMSSVK